MSPGCWNQEGYPVLVVCQHFTGFLHPCMSPVVDISEVDAHFELLPVNSGSCCPVRVAKFGDKMTVAVL